MSDPAYRDLLDYLRETEVLASCGRLLGWDQETLMPRRGAELRSEQTAAIAGLVHRRRLSDGFRRLIDDARPGADSRGAESPDAANVREAARDHDRATRIPVELVEERARTRTLARRAWVEARSTSDFGLFLPWLEKIVDIARRWADAAGYEEHPYDALLDEYEPGATTSQLRELFGPLRTALADLIGRLLDRGTPVDSSRLRRRFPVEAQRGFARAVTAAIGFDFDGGRLDDTVHPFCSGIGPGDVRITARWDEHNFGDGFFSVIHEAGHGLYEQGRNGSEFGAPVGQACSLGIHESQSRMWENLVGRSLGFWRHFLPPAQRAFPEALGDCGPEEFYRAVNEVKPSLIRVDADEVTYNLHVFLRFEIEQALVTGDLEAAGVPAAWNERFEQSLRLTPQNDAEGCLQDVHWSAGLFGYFPTYTLGNVYASQIFDRAQEELGDLDEAFARGEFAPLREWLKTRIHREGRRYLPRRLVEVVTGAPPSPDALVSHLETRYGAVYAL